MKTDEAHEEGYGLRAPKVRRKVVVNGVEYTTIIEARRQLRPDFPLTTLVNRLLESKGDPEYALGFKNTYSSPFYSIE